MPPALGACPDPLSPGLPALGLPKARFVFNTIRNGRIHVNDLLLTLHTLGILVTSTEMRTVLKAIDIDGEWPRLVSRWLFPAPPPLTRSSLLQQMGT